MDKNTLMNALKNSRNIISKDLDGTLDAIAKQKGQMMEGFDDENGNMIVEATAAMPKDPTREFNTKKMGGMADKLPREIVESFRKNQIDTSGMGGSVLDSVNIPSSKKQQPKKQIIREVSTPQANAPIDYSMIKMIVESTVKKEIETIKETFQFGNNEMGAMISTNGGFKFLTKNGDIYEAKLIKKGNINESKGAPKK